MANAEEAQRFLLSFYVVDFIFKRFIVNMGENASIVISLVLFQCSNICWITLKGFDPAAFGLVFKHLPHDPANV